MIDLSFLKYLGEVSVYLSLLVLLYWFGLRQLTFFSISRFYLLISLFVSLAAPITSFEVLPIEYPENDSATPFVATPIIQEVVTKTMEISRTTYFDLGQSVLGTIYVFGVFLFALRFLHNLLRIFIDSNSQSLHVASKFKIFRTQFRDAYTFLNRIYLPARSWNSEERSLILSHEFEHARRWHSLDRLLTEVMLIIFWFNPIVYLYKKALVEIHEFEADLGVIRRHKKASYQMLLLRQAFNDVQVPLASTFSSLTKKRISMMNKSKSKISSLGRYLFAFPIVGGLMFVFSFDLIDQVEWSSATKPMVDSKQDVPADLVPSIFPISASEVAKVKVSSSFGKRRDPFDKTMKFHHGLDIAAPTGTPVIATADGVVHELEEQPNGYGKFIWIKHDETYATRYAQLDSYEVEAGDKVKKGQVIAYVGSSGRSTAPHLHYEVSKNNEYVNPQEYIKNYQFKTEK